MTAQPRARPRRCPGTGRPFYAGAVAGFTCARCGRRFASSAVAAVGGVATIPAHEAG